MSKTLLFFLFMASACIYACSSQEDFSSTEANREAAQAGTLEERIASVLTQLHESKGVSVVFYFDPNDKSSEVYEFIPNQKLEQRLNQIRSGLPIYSDSEKSLSVQKNGGCKGQLVLVTDRYFEAKKCIEYEMKRGRAVCVTFVNNKYHIYS